MPRQKIHNIDAGSPVGTLANTPQQNTDGLPPPEQAFEWPREAIRMRDWSEAARRWAVLRKAYPDHRAAWFQGVVAHIEAGEQAPAEALLSHVREVFPDHPNTLILSAKSAIQRQDWTTAETFLHQARERFPDNEQTWITSAACAEGQGMLELAHHYNGQARQRFPNSTMPYYQHAELAMQAGKWEEALSRWQDFRARFPDRPAGYLRAAEAARQLDKPGEARRLMLAHQYGADMLKNPEDAEVIVNSDVRTRSGRLIELIWTKAIFNLRSEVHRSYLSYGWWVLEPLLHMVVYYVVFGMLLQRGDENFAVFLLTGLIPWMWFSKGVSASSSSILGGQQLMMQVGLPAIVFPLVSLLQNSIKQLPAIVLLVGFVWVNGFTPGASWLALLPVILVQIMLMTAFACFVAAVIPFMRDLAYLVPTGLMFIMFLSGIFYDYRVIPEDWQSVFLLNPIAFFLKCYREIFMSNTLPDMQTLYGWGLISGIACLVVAMIYKRLRYIYPRIVLE